MLPLVQAWLRSLAGRRPAPPALMPGETAFTAASNTAVFQAGLALSTEGLVLLDQTGRVVALNSSAEALLQAAPDTLLGADFWEALPECVTDGQRAAAQAASAQGGPHSFVARSAFEDQWVAYSVRPHGSGALVSLTDVSAEHQALRLLRDSDACNQALFEAHAQAMWLFDAGSGRLLAANRAAAELYGSTQSALVGVGVATLFPDAEGAALLGGLPAGDFQQELRLCTQQKAGGERMLVELSCASVQWQLRAAVLVSVTDVGARHLADGQLRRINDKLAQGLAQCNAELQRSREELEAFTSAMLHDLKAPLHVVDGFASRLAERCTAGLDDRSRHYLSRIQASARLLSGLIDDLHTLAYLPRMTLVRERVDLVPVCQRVMDDLRLREPHRSLVFELDPVLAVVGDNKLLVTAMACLLGNAWKFSAKKEQAWIKVGLAPASTPQVPVLQVSDNGAGFDPAYASKMFSPFQRLHSSADFPGNGLGLAMVRQIARLHGGQAWAVASGQGGASFFLSLPQDAQAASPDRPLD